MYSASFWGRVNIQEAVLTSLLQPGNEAEIEFWGWPLLISDGWPSILILNGDGWIYYILYTQKQTHTHFCRGFFFLPFGNFCTASCSVQRSNDLVMRWSPGGRNFMHFEMNQTMMANVCTFTPGWRLPSISNPQRRRSRGLHESAAGSDISHPRGDYLSLFLRGKLEKRKKRRRTPYLVLAGP